MRRIQKYYTDFANSLFATKFLDSESSPFFPPFCSQKIQCYCSQLSVTYLSQIILRL